ncbi:MAG: DUF4418 family protein [Anaerolineae bacterium]
MRYVAAGLIIVLAILIGAIPQFTDCQSQGRALTLANGKQVSMKCHWTGQGELALAVPFVAVGALMGFSRRKESQRNLGLVGIVLGVLVILLPTALIGVCASPDMLCNSVMRPALILLGSVVTAISLLIVVSSIRGQDEVV